MSLYLNEECERYKNYYYVYMPYVSSYDVNKLNRNDKVSLTRNGHWRISLKCEK